MNLTIEQLENIYNYIANRSNKDTSFPISSYEDLNMFTGLNKENKNVLFKKEIIDDKFDTITSDYIHRINNLSNFLQSEITDIKDNYIKKGDSDQTFILDNGERKAAIIDVDDEVDYSEDNAYITLVSSDDKTHGINLFSARENQAGLMSAADKKKLDNAVENDGEASITAINHIQSIDGDNTEGLNINNVNGISALGSGSATEFWNTNGGKTDVGTNGLTTNGDIKIEGDNYITTINKSGGILIYDKTKGINTIDINGVDSKITFNVRQGNSYNTQDITLVPNSVLTTKSIKLTDKLYTENNYTNNKLYFGISSTNFLTKLNNLNTSFYSGIGANCDFGVVYNNKSVVIKNDKISFINDSTTHDTEGTISYDGDTDVLNIGSSIDVIGYIKGQEYYVTKNHAINFVYDTNKETSISADAANGHIIVNNAIKCNKHITCDGIYSDSTISVTSDETKSGVLRSNGLYFDDTETENDMSITANVNNNLFMFDRQIQIDINDTVLSTLNDNSITFYDKQIDDTFSIAYDKDCQCIVTDSNFKFYNTVNIANAITLNDNDNKAIVIYNNTDNYSEINTSKSDSINLDYSSSSLKANTLIEANAITINYNDVNYSDKYNAVYREKQMSLKREHDGDIYNTLIAPNNIKCYIGNSININYTEFNNSGYYIHGENNYNQTSLTYNLNLNTKDDFNGISKAVYSANSISISNTDSDGVQTNTIELSAIDNSIRFITKTLSDNKTTTYKFNVQKAIELGLLTKE